MQKTISLILKGFCMGTADVIPGVSGGTMAFILGIYEELIEAIRTFGQKKFWQLVLTGKFQKAKAMVPWRFLFSVLFGILLAIITLAQTLEHLLETQPLAVWSFFFGLILASIYIVGRRIQKWTPQRWALVLLGSACAYLMVGLVPVHTPETWWFLILCGAIAICAMILPGVSGAFLLVLLGKYEFILRAVNDRDILSIAFVGIGAVLGIIAFAQVLHWLFKHYHDETVALLTGLMLGSLRKIWPWKIQDTNMIPSLLKNGDLNPEYVVGAILIFAGVMVVLGIEKCARRTH